MSEISKILQEFYDNGYKKGYEDAKKKFERPQGDLISREALKKAFEDTVCIEPMPYAFVKQIIDNAPTVEEESTGEWECARIGNTNFITCSHCKEQFETENTLELWQDEYKFCHRCGAKMKGVPKND